MKSLLQETRWCNRILIRILGLAATTFFSSKNMGYLLMLSILDFLHACMRVLPTKETVKTAHKKNPPLFAFYVLKITFAAGRERSVRTPGS